jgi:hypothetical protein
MKKIYLGLIAFVSFVVVVFVNSYIPPSYDMIEQQEVSIDFEKRLGVLHEDLKPCKEEDNPGLVAECEYPINNEIKELEFKQKSKTFVVGPITYYYAGGEVEVSDQGMAVFNLELLAENTGSSDIVILHCSGAVSCNYHVWDGKTKFIFSSNNFAAGNIGINPGQVKSLNIIFGPGQGYGNYVDFEYDPSREYFLLIEESFGSADIPLELITKTSN